ncbi:MAG: DUF3604 domain-containing protein [Symploca sp. SIO2C1]|nr:DUF3604 domain-containing protein [Symploca sp. SIO2C1]
MLEGGEVAAEAANEIVQAFAQGTIPAYMLQSAEDFATAWQNEVDWAEAYNEPYLFTAFIGYE